MGVLISSQTARQMVSDALDTVTGRKNYLANAGMYPGMQSESLRQSILLLQSQVGLMQVRQQSYEETMADFQQTMGRMGELESSFAVKQAQNSAAIVALYAQGEVQAADILELSVEDDHIKAEAASNKAHDLLQDADITLVKADSFVVQARLRAVESQQAVLVQQQALAQADELQDDQAVAALQAQLAQLQTKLTADEATLASHTTVLEAAKTSASNALAAAAAAQQKADATAANLVIAQAATTAAQTTANNAVAAAAALNNRIREVLGVVTPTLTLSVGGSFQLTVSWAASATAAGAFTNTEYAVLFTNVGSNVLKNLSWVVKTKNLHNCVLEATSTLAINLALTPSAMDFLIYHT